MTEISGSTARVESGVHRAPRRSRAALAIPLAVAIAVSWLATRGISWGAVLAALRPDAAGWVIAATITNALALPLQAATWVVLAGLVRDPPASAAPDPSWRALLPIAATAVMIMNTVPWGAGHAVAAVMLAHRDGGGLGVRRATAVMLLEQLAEGVTKGAVLAIAVGFGPVSSVLRGVLVILALALAGAAALGLLLARIRHTPLRWRPPGWSALVGDASLRWRGSVVARALTLVLAAKVVEGIAIACLWRGYHLPLPLTALPVALGTALVSTMLPLSPGNVGPYEAAVSTLYHWLGVERPLALAVSIVQHATFLVPVIGAGAVVALTGGPLARRDGMEGESQTTPTAQPVELAIRWGLLGITVSGYALIPSLHQLLSGGPVAYLDPLVQQWELALFGIMPARDLAAMLPGPVVRELLQLGYLSFYPLVVAPLAWLHYRGRHDAFLRTVAAVVGVFLTCYVLFLVIPVLGPRYLWPEAPPGALSGPVASLVRAILAAGSSAGTAFPSLHAALAVTLTVMAWRTRALPVAPLALLTTALCLGAVAGGYHYAVDIIAGVAVGIAVPLSIDRRR